MLTVTRLTLQPEQWMKVRELYSKLVDAPIEDRPRLIRDLSAGDSQIESQLRGLLLAHGQNSSFLNEPAFEALSLASVTAVLPEIEPGVVLANRYTVRRLLNHGGMGAVYEAWDSELQEAVALKLIRPEIASQPEVIERFKQEVKQGRRVTHPNICRVYDLSSHDLPNGNKLWFLTMQLLEGKTLLEAIRETGPMPRKKALELIEQMVAGLQAAHEVGIVHRDFKSANVMLVPGPGGSPRAVITDFGLAASVADMQADGSIHAGQGTPAYAPPEQWSEGKVSPAADQYSLGIVICEMLTGERPVLPERGPHQTWSHVKLPSHPNLNHRLQAAIHRCIAVEPEKRFRSLRDLNRALGIGRQRMVIRMLSIPVAMLLVTIGLRLATTKSTKYLIKDLTQVTPWTDLSTSPSLSRDGSVLAYAAESAGTEGQEIWIRHLTNGQAVQVTRDGFENDAPSISPDGRQVTYESARDQGALYLSNTDGSDQRQIAATGMNPRFSPDGRSILYWTGNENSSVPSGQIYVFSLDHARAIRLATDFSDAREPIWNSDGRHILFQGCKSRAISLVACWDWWVATFDQRQMEDPEAGIKEEEPVKTGARAKFDSEQLALSGDLGGWYGKLVLFNAERNGKYHLWALPLSVLDPRHPGDPEEVSRSDANENVFSSTLGGSDLVAIANLVYAIHIWRIDAGTAPDESRAHPMTHDAQSDRTPSVSPNGRWLAFARGLDANREIWVEDTKSGQEHLYPFGGSDKISPLVDDNSSTIVFEALEGGSPSVYVWREGAAPVKICSGSRTPTGWFNGEREVFVSDPNMSRVELCNLSTGRISPILSDPSRSMAQATWSPQGQMLLFTATRDNIRHQVFAVRFAAASAHASGAWVPITPPSEDSILPRWSSDGKTIYYLSDRHHSLCIWARRFDVEKDRPQGEPFEVRHFAGKRFSSVLIMGRTLNMSVAGNTVYLNVAESSSSIWMGHLEEKGRLSQLFTFF